MSISIKKEKCVGCKKCLSVCPGSLIKLDEQGKAYIKYPKDCWGCSSCVKECGQCAIAFYLGADIGGVGSKLYTKAEKNLVHWNIEKNNGEIHVIDINPQDSNQY